MPVSRYTRPFTKALRKFTQPLVDPIRQRINSSNIQRAVPLRTEDRDKKRRRGHVLVDLLYESCPRERVVVAEIGVRGGETSHHLLKYCPQIERLYGVDLVRPDPARCPVMREDRFHFIEGDSKLVASRFEDETFDLVFIDADHSEGAVRLDIAAWQPKVKVGGVIGGHDYGGKNHTGVALAVDDIYATHHHPVVIDANKVWWTIR
jgi:predicted O-methyltransferase YrrM